MDQIRNDIKEFTSKNTLDKILLLWIANTVCLLSVKEGVNDTCENLPTSFYRVEPDINSSTIFTVSSILKGCTYINSSPQNTSVFRVIELSRQQKVFVVGDYFKKKQTKIQAVLINLPVSAGINPVSNVRYNHLGKNLLWTAFDNDYVLFQAFRSHLSLPPTYIISTNNYIITSYHISISIFTSDTIYYRQLTSSPNDKILLSSVTERVFTTKPKNDTRNSYFPPTSLANPNPGSNLNISWIHQQIYTKI